MTRDLSYNNIGYGAATFKVDDDTIAILKANHLDASTGRIDVNDKKLAVALTGDNTVGFGAAATATDATPLFGFIVTYEEDGFAAVQYAGYMEAVPVAGAIALGATELAVNNAGQVSVVATAKGRGIVTKAATASDKFVNVLIG